MQLLRLIPFLALACAFPSDAAHAAAPALSCDTLGKTRLSLVISRLVYGASWVFSTPAHLATAQGQVGFTVLNSLISAPITCSAQSSQEYTFFNGAPAYACDVSKVPPAVGARASFTFDTANGGTVGLTASWNCVDSRSHQP